ncbi:MAG TPA: DUF4242 domain-containing protein [Actinomycetota bacterium]|nr:DUF4242 domain-containing protein [Actinomycetota bacterium]
MPRFIIERDLPEGLSRDDVDDASRRAIAANADMPGVRWLHSHLALDHSKFFCEYEAPDENAVRESASRAQIPCDLVTEVVEVAPEHYTGSRL